MATTYNNLYMDIRRQLKQAGYTGAGLEARELVCCGSGKSREEFFRMRREENVRTILTKLGIE